tara:strand:- start:589 stop:1539 length:951 start_codon:yes stop_codon:yes gene_type:complete
MKLIYVTGCLGFMGSHFTRAALELGWKVYGVDKLTYAANSKLLDEFCNYDNFSFERKDIKNLTHLYDCDYVVNYAAESHVGNSIVSSDDFINTNILGVKNLLELIRHKQENCNPRPAFLHLSTDEVYGDINHGEHTEEDLLCPSNPYAASKAAADMLILAWARTYGLRYNILRPTNNYGIGQYPEKLIPLSVKNLMRGKKIRLHNGGTPYRNWLHVDDTTAAVMTVINSGFFNEVYNVAGNFEQQNLDTVRKIIVQYHGDRENYKEHIDFSYSRIGQDVRYALNDEKIKNLGWKPKKSFDEEIIKIVEYYKDNWRW